MHNFKHYIAFIHDNNIFKNQSGIKEYFKVSSPKYILKRKEM